MQLKKPLSTLSIPGTSSASNPNAHTSLQRSSSPPNGNNNSASSPKAMPKKPGAIVGGMVGAGGGGGEAGEASIALVGVHAEYPKYTEEKAKEAGRGAGVGLGYR